MSTEAEDRRAALIELLHDPLARVDLRDDAAIDLGAFSGEAVEEALATVAGDSIVDDIIRASCGESLAEIWIRQEQVNDRLLSPLREPARREALKRLSVSGHLSVNATLQALEILADQDVVVYGQLVFDYEELSLNHLPKGERSPGTASSIWIELDRESPRLDRAGLQRSHGKWVRVQGILHPPDPAFGGSGHFSGWPAEIRLRALERVKINHGYAE